MAAVSSDRRPADPYRLPDAAATPLARAIAQRIREEGPLTFAAFMEAALYDESLGYYRRDAPTVGREGDYLTSPELHPLFAYAVAALAAELWERLGSPEPFVLREVGPGTGALAEGVATWAAAQRPDFSEVLRFELVERAAAAVARQRRRLAPLGERASWIHDHRAPQRGLLFANELLDAQPVHRLRWRRLDSGGGRWDELYVGLDGEGGFAERAGPASSESLLEPLAEVAPREEQVVEVSPSAGRLVKELAGSLERGLLLLLDYGYPRERLYAPWRSEGTLLTYYRHTPGSDPYTRVGEQDISCHVDVDAVTQAACAAGLQPLPLQTQAQFLMALGASRLPEMNARGTELEAQLSRRRAAAALGDPEGLGRVQVMAFSRGVEGELGGLR